MLFGHLIKVWKNAWQKGPPLEIWVSLLIYCKQIVPNVRYHKEAYYACAAHQGRGYTSEGGRVFIRGTIAPPWGQQPSLMHIFRRHNLNRASWPDKFVDPVGVSQPADKKAKKKKVTSAEWKISAAWYCTHWMTRASSSSPNSSIIKARPPTCPCATWELKYHCKG